MPWSFAAAAASASSASASSGPAPPLSPAEMDLLVARTGLTLNPGQMADLVLAWRQLAGLIASIPRQPTPADDQAFAFRLPSPASPRKPATKPASTPKARPAAKAKAPKGAKPIGKPAPKRPAKRAKAAARPARKR